MYLFILSIISRQIYIYIYILYVCICTQRSYSTSTYIVGTTGSLHYVAGFDVASLHDTYICFDAVYTTIYILEQHHCLFVHQPPAPKRSPNLPLLLLQFSLSN